MKVFALLPLATLLFAVAVSGDDELESNKLPGSNGGEVSVTSENNPSDNGYSVSAGNGNSNNGSSVSYDEYSHDDEPNEHPGNKLSVQYDSKNQTSNGRGRRRHQRGQRRHNHEYNSHRGHGIRHEHHGASNNGSHSHGGHRRHESHRNSSHVSHHGSRHGGHQGSSSGRLIGALENLQGEDKENAHSD